jgi:hypothetical protein
MIAFFDQRFDFQPEDITVPGHDRFEIIGQYNGFTGIAVLSSVFSSPAVEFICHQS